MAIAKTLHNYLENKGIEYELVTHPHSGSSMETAESAGVSGDALAKGIALKDQAGTLLVVVPSDYHIELDTLNDRLGRQLHLVPEEALQTLFPDCELGAVPPIGSAYAIESLWDPEASLGVQERVYFEAGDHVTLIQVTGEHFHELMADAQRAHFSHHI